jgi:CRP-like cAMP-binding protein
MIAQLSNEELISILQSTEPFQYLNKQELEVLIPYGELIGFGDKDIILKQGQKGPGLFILVKGKIKVTVRILGQGEIKLAHLSSGQFFGEVNILTDTPCTATIRSIGKSCCFLLNKSTYNMLFIAAPKIRYLINRSLAENIISRQNEMLNNIQRNANVSKKKIITLSPEKSIKPYAKKINLSTQGRLKELAHLKSLPIFNGLNSTEISYLARTSDLLNVSKQYIIMKPNGRRSSFFFILKGAVKVGIESQNTLIKFTVLGPNNFFSSTSIIGNKREPFRYEACENALLLEVTSTMLTDIKSNQPLLWYKIQGMCCEYIASLQKKLNAQVVRMRCEAKESLTIK